MFGYVMTNKQTLSEDESKRFSACYCGLCRSLGARHGTVGQLALSFDMVFLAMLLSSLYEPETVSGSGRCLIHPRKKRDYVENTFTDYAADMTVALAYHKALDNWRDDKSIGGRLEAQLLKPHYKRIEALYPRQTEAIEQGIRALSDLENAGESSIDPPANAFGAMLGELFVYKKDMWSDMLRQMGSSLGRFIYLMDAYDDLNDDIKKGRYNPLISLSNSEDFEERTFSYLTLFLGEGTVAFEQLPLIEDLPILRNILYSGVWTKYQMIKRKRCGKEANE